MHPGCTCRHCKSHVRSSTGRYPKNRALGAMRLTFIYYRTDQEQPHQQGSLPQAVLGVGLQGGFLPAASAAASNHSCGASCSVCAEGQHKHQPSGVRVGVGVGVGLGVGGRPVACCHWASPSVPRSFAARLFPFFYELPQPEQQTRWLITLQCALASCLCLEGRQAAGGGDVVERARGPEA